MPHSLHFETGAREFTGRSIGFGYIFCYILSTIPVANSIYSSTGACMFKKISFQFALSLIAASSAMAQTKWDLPAAYPATNFHTENLTQFAKDVDAATAGKLKITVHANASLFKAPEIKRAVQSGQAQLGEILLANFANENPVYALDGVPFLATSYADSKKLYQASKATMDKLLAAQGMKILFSVAWPPQGIYSKKEVSSVADLRGIKWRAYSPATAKIAELIGAQPVLVRHASLAA
jgi:TRAP-type transport system periplasmic protein